ncbi:MAG TPA: amino acid adenylation domain-containing protein [Pyrinomonadaceae bacterium]
MEAALLAEAEISECVVLARDDEAGQKRLVAYVVAEELDERAIRDGLQARLPDYMVPAAFVRLERLPLSVNGKLERRALPEPDWKRLGLRREFVAARTAAEAELARIWCEVLGLERVGMQDNFFELGGDSILSLQIIARAAAAGLRVTAKQLFQQPTIAALVQVAEGEVSTGRDWTEQGTVSGPAGLTPIQRWFFAQEREKPEHFNQAMMLRVSADLQAKYLREAVRALLDHHDALRMRFRKDEEGKWEQYNEPVRQQRAACAPEVHEVEVIGEAYTTVAEQIQRSLSLSDGPMLRVVLMRSDATEARLLLVLHHLVVDGVSWRILLQDLQTAYEQLSRGDSLRLPAKTNSYQQWSTRLQDYAASAQLANDAAYWREQPWERATQLRLDHEDGRNQRQDAQQVTIELGREQTRRLLQEAPKTYRTGIQELLLTAFASVLSEWNESEAVLLELEGHGREESIADVTRTVGWFTTLYPVLLQVERGAGTGERIKSVKEQLRAVPTGGLAYGVQRYLSDKANPRLPQAEIVFNYLGQLDHVLTENGLIHGVASESTGSSEDPNAARPWLLEINGEVVGGQLRLRWSYSAKQFERQTIERVAQQYQTELEALIEHCCDSAGGRTPSDYPLARLKQAEVDHLAGDGREVEDIYPTTPLQQGLLFQSLYAPSAGFYHQQVSCRLSGDFESGRFVQAWHKVITRHAIFRTGFVWEGLAAPLQIVYRATELPVDEHDWRTLSSSEQATRWDELRREDRKRGFRLETAPLMRLVLARVSETEYRLLWSHHHLLLDGWCLALVMDEVFAAYDGQVDAVTVNRPYRDYIAWLQEQDLDAAEKYWRHTLSDFTEPTLVLERRGRGARQNEQGQRWVRLTAEQTQRLQERARREQVTMNTVLQGAWALLLSRYSGTSDVVFGTTVSGRPAKLASVEQMIGLFINTLPVRIRIPVNQPVWDWLRELQTEQLEMLQYEYSPLAQVQQWSEVAAGKSLFETLLAYENYPIEQSMRAGHHTNLQVKDVDVWERSNYPLAVVVMPGVELAIEMTYERERFDDESIAQLGAHLLTLLEEIETKGNVADVAMLKADERRQLREWNETTVDYPHHLCIHELFTAQVKQTPDAVAVSYEGKQLTYHELNQHSDQLAIRLKSLGVGPGVLVGVFMKHSPEEIAALLAILKSGGAYVPLEPAHPPARVAFIINDAQLSLILTQQEMHGRLPETKVSAICVDVEEQPDAPESFKSNSTPGDIAYVIYTSGSTGEPKGASISYRALVNYAWWAKHVYVQDETAGFALYSSLAFDLTVTSIYVPLISGGKIVIHEWEGSEARKEAPLAKILADGETTVLKLTPSHLSLIKDWDNRQTTVKRLIVGGEALTGELALETYESFGGHVEICNEYGPTEATVGCMLHIFDPQTEAMSDVPIGRPAANVQIYVLDDRLEPTAAGVNGELYIAGDGLAQGYLNRPDLTAARFIPNPFKPGKRMYRSGDLARRLSNGILEYLGRQDDQIKFHGYRVELNEIRATLKRHPQVRDSVVLITQDKNGSDVMVAYYVSRHELEAIELRTFLSNFLIAETIPNIFVRLARVPLTVNGKINYQALPSLDEAKQSLKRSYERARTTPEEILAGVWGEVLSLERVGIHDNFFDLGGHSLLATQLISRIREAFSVEIALRTLFEKPTVAGMATAIEERLRAGQEVELPPLEPASRDNSLPLSFSQQRLWFMDQLQPGSAFYNSALAVRLTGQLKKDVLDRTLSEIVRRHESLRTTFENSGAGPVQIIAAPAAQKIPLIDLSGLAAESSNAERQRLSNEEAAAPFDLSKGPLLRVLLLRTAVTEHVVLLTMHHIISDGWSMEVLVKEVAELYRAYSEHFSGPQASSPASLSTEEQTKTPAVLSELQVQYADFAIWQRSWLQGDTLGRELDYWKRRLAGAPATTEFPTDRPRPAVQTHNGARASFTIPESLVESLKRFSRERNATLFMTLLTAFNVLLHRYSGQDDLVIGTPLAGRNRPELENLIGIFINNLVLRTDLSGDPTFIELLSKVREGFLEAYAHQDVPFEKLVEELQVNRDPGRSPLFQVPFGFQPLPGQKFKLPGLELEPLSIENETARFDLTVWIFETANGLNASWTYNTDLFYESTIKRLHGQFETLLVNILKQPEARLSSFEMLSESEQREREDQEAQQQATALDKLMKARRKSVPLSA